MAGSYRVFLEKSAQRDLERMPQEVFSRIVACMKGLAENPRPPGCRKIAGSSSDWRIRVGDYRIVYEIDDRLRRVIVFRVRHRKDVY